MPSRSHMIAQITDCHLLAEAGERLHGLDPDESLARVLEVVRASSPEVVVASGDLTETGAPDAYRRLKVLLQTLDCPVACLPGNHDDVGAMRRHLLGDGIEMPGSLAVGEWRLYLLDDTVPGRPEGRLGASRLAELEWHLHGQRGRKKGVFVHHQPVATDSPWIDDMGLTDGDSLMELLGRDGDVALVAFGHIHHAFTARRNGIRLYGTPATSFQARPAKPRFELDTANGPGFRWFRLFPEGTLETGVTRVPVATDR